MHRSSLVLAALAALAFAACTNDATGPTAVAPNGRMNEPSFSHIDYGNGRWSVTTVLPWEMAGDGAAYAINDVGQVVGSQNGRAYRAAPGGEATFYESGAVVRGLNDANDAVGWVVRDGLTRATLWRATGERVDLAARSGSGASVALDINDAGQVVGEAGGQAALWEPDGSVVDIGGAVGAPGSRAVAINNGGTVVGYATASGGATRAFVWNAASGAEPLAGAQSAAFGLNDRGIIVGRVVGEPVAWTSTSAYTVLRAGGSFADQAFAINDDGVIVGANVTGRPLVWPSMSSEPIDVARAACAAATVEQPCRGIIGATGRAINDRGQIAGGVSQEYYLPSTGRVVAADNGVVFTFVPTTGTGGEGLLRIRDLGDNLCLDIQGASDVAGDPGKPATTYYCHGGANQRVTFTAAGEARLYGDQCLDLWGAQGNDGDRVVLWPCHGGANQQWRRTPEGLVVGLNGKCLEVPGLDTTPGTPLVVWSCHGGANQKWDVVPTGPNSAVASR